MTWDFGYDSGMVIRELPLETRFLVQCDSISVRGGHSSSATAGSGTFYHLGLNEAAEHLRHRGNAASESSE